MRQKSPKAEDGRQTSGPASDDMQHIPTSYFGG